MLRLWGERMWIREFEKSLDAVDCLLAIAAAHRAQQQLRPKEYKAKLRQTALRLPAKIVGKAVQKMKDRIALVFEAKGGNIPRD